MEIRGKLKVFKNEYEGNVYYNTSVSNKNINGEYEYLSISLQLPKGTVLENKSDIDVSKGFMSFYVKKDGTKVPKIIVQEFDNKTVPTAPQDIETTEPTKEKADPFEVFGDSIELENVETELPW